MVNPIYIIAVFLGAAFLHPLVERITSKRTAGLDKREQQNRRNPADFLVFIVLAFSIAVPVLWLARLSSGVVSPGGIITETAGFSAPLSINLRVGTEEAVFLLLVNTAAGLGSLFFAGRNKPVWRGKSQILFITMLLGVNGMIMTRDLFNIFVFLEITSISIYALIAFARSGDAHEAGFKYMVAGGIASSIFLIGVIYIYRLTGTLNLDMITAANGLLSGEGASGLSSAGKAGITAGFLITAAILLELKPFPANGWGADAYEASDPAVSAMASAVSATGVFVVLYKIMPMMGEQILRFSALSGGVTFLFSQFLAMKQGKVRRMLGYSSIGQVGLLVFVTGMAPMLGKSGFPGNSFITAGNSTNGVFFIIILLAANHIFSKAGLFWMSDILRAKTIAHRGRILSMPGIVGSNVQSKSGPTAEGGGAGRQIQTGLLGILVSALAGFPPFPAFWAKWFLVAALVSSGAYLWAAVILLGSLIEAWYLVRWFLNYSRNPVDGGQVHDETVPGDFPEQDHLLSSRRNSDVPPAGMAVESSSGRAVQAIIAPVFASILLAAAGIYIAFSLLSGPGVGSSGELFLLFPLASLALFWLFDLLGVPFKVQAVAGIAVTAAYGVFFVTDLEGIRLIFGMLFIAGAAYQMFPLISRDGRNPGLMGMLTAMVFSMGNLLLFRTALGFFLSWEMMTVSSFFLIARGKRASAAALRYLLFSLAGAFMILAGLALGGVSLGTGFSQSGNLLLFTDVIAASVTGSIWIPILLGLGFLVKLGAFGLHIWLPASYAEADDDLSAFFSSILSKTGLYMLFLTAVLFSGNIMQAGSRNSLSVLFADTAFNGILGWIGVITAFAGAFMALFKEDIKYTLAYSSMGQVGYMLLSFALMSQLGWMNSLYLAVTHLFFKGMLFVAIAGVVSRTGTRMMYRMGGLISRMPVSFFTVLIAIIALSGVPPLTGFGAKWMLYTALLEKGWYLQAGIAMFASAVAFLYLFRLIHSIFLGQLKDEHREVKEAPVWFLIPQFVGIAGTMLVSMYPNVLLKPIQAAVAPFFTGDIAWEGYTVISTLGYWNGNAVMYVTMGVFMLPLAWMLIVQRKNTQKVEQFNIVFAAERPYKPETTHYAYNFFAHYRKALGFLYTPGITRFWNWVGSIAEVTGSSVRKLYSGNVQTYALLIVLYISAALLLLRGGVWA